MPDSVCPLGGVLIYAGIDVNRDGVLGDDEVDLANPTEHLCSSGAVDPFEGVVFLAPTTADNLALYKADARGGEPVKLAATTDAASSLGNVVGTSDPFYFPNTFKASPDGRMVAFMAMMRVTDPMELYVASLYEDRPLTKVSGPMGTGKGILESTGFAWSPDGALLAYRAVTASANPDLLVATAQSPGTSVSVTSDLASTGGVLSFAFSKSSRFLAYLANLDGAETTSDELYVTPAGEEAQARRVGTFSGSVVEYLWP